MTDHIKRTEPIDWQEAQHKLISTATPLGSETVDAADAVGRYLTQDIIAKRTQPAADLSAMDGYAMRADDLNGPWQVVGESAAGHPYTGALSKGQAIRISTGALVPQDADAILLQENATREGATVRLNGEGEPTPRHIRRKGFDFSKDEILQPAGKVVTPATLALAISSGNSSVSIGKRPSVAILDSGDELSDDPSTMSEHQIPASNGPMLQAMVQPFASNVKRIGPVADDMGAVLSALEEASQCDVLVTSGGVSVGDHDLIKPALEKWGARIEFWRIAMKPGKPLMVASKGNQHIIGLPGNPVSSYVTAYLFVLPLLRQLSGANEPEPKALQLFLRNELPATGSRAEFVRAWAEDGNAYALKQQDSSGLHALSHAAVLIYRPANAPALKDGAPVTAFPLLNGGLA